MLKNWQIQKNSYNQFFTKNWILSYEKKINPILNSWKINQKKKKSQSNPQATLTFNRPSAARPTPISRNFRHAEIIDFALAINTRWCGASAGFRWRWPRWPRSCHYHICDVIIIINSRIKVAIFAHAALEMIEDRGGIQVISLCVFFLNFNWFYVVFF